MLKLVWRDNHWHVHGTLHGQRIRKSLGTGDRKHAEQLKAQLEDRIHKRQVFGEEAVRTFEEAALSYMQQGGEPRFLAPLITHFKGRILSSIKPGDIRSAALKLYPKAAAATRNRQAVTPAKAVINHASQLGWCQKIAVDAFPTAKSRKHSPVDRDWLDAFIAEARARNKPHLAALVLFMNQTAARRSEAVRLKGEHVDLEKRIALLEKTKTEEWSVRHLTEELVSMIRELDPGPEDLVFGYEHPTSVNKAMKLICKSAGIPVRSTHSAGRHSFATNAMQLPGIRVKAAMEAGGWKSSRLFMETYVHDRSAGEEIARALDTKLTKPT